MPDRAELVRLEARQVYWHEAPGWAALLEQLAAAPAGRARVAPIHVFVVGSRGAGRRAYALTEQEAAQLLRWLREREFSELDLARAVRAGVPLQFLAPDVRRPERPAVDPVRRAVWLTHRFVEPRFPRVLPMWRYRLLAEAERRLRRPADREPTGGGSGRLPSQEADLGPPRPPDGEREPRVLAPIETGVLRRTPHMDLSVQEPLTPGSEFGVEVWCDEAPAREGEQSEPISVELPAAVEEMELAVWLARSLHFEAARLTSCLRITRGQPRSTTARFELRVVDDPPPGPALLTAVFSFDGRPSGQVQRRPEIGADRAPAPDDADSPPPDDSDDPPRARAPGDAPPASQLLANWEAEPPDLVVEIKATAGDEQHFACRVSSRVLGSGTTPADWRLPSRVPELVTGYMADFTDSGIAARQRLVRLRGAGLKLWDAAPENFKAVFWELIDRGNPPRSILIATDDWAMPWELMIPTRDQRADERPPLGVEFAVGRWVSRESLTPRARVPLTDAHVFAPAYPGERALPKAEAEASYVCARFHGTRIEPGNSDRLDDCFASRATALAHFVCHGELRDGRQAIQTEDMNWILEYELRAMRGLADAVASASPLVFLNACEAARRQPALVGSEGFATAFLELGARAVVAPLWSVEDDVAHDLALAFYDALQATPGRPLAEIMAELRGRGYQEDAPDTWAAYCFFGHPGAVAAV